MYSFTDSCNRTQNVTVRKTDDIFWLEIVGLPVLVVVCTIGNLLNIIVMTCERPSPRTGNAHMVSKATKVFLLAMAISDLILMWLQVPRYLAEYVQNIQWGENSDLALGFKNFYGAQQWWSDASITFSDWVLIAFSIERLRSFRHLAYSFRTAKESVAKESVGQSHEPVSATSSTSSDDQPWNISGTSRVLDMKTISGAALRTKSSKDRENGGRAIRRRTAVIIVICLLIAALTFTVENAVYFFYWRVQDPNDGQPYHKFRPEWITLWHFYHNILDVAMTVAKFAALLLINAHLILILFQQQATGYFSNGKDSQLRTHRKRHSSCVPVHPISCVLTILHIFSHSRCGAYCSAHHTNNSILQLFD
ncbi:uncharacterized protein LOC129588628 [Paramacrobiotus metropolitanus]|uniref:uncharacterized protein LOC129588628 n=1 Tax=Paramacrobiotus metropolitanus TaxID=2943436 RepID=UPI0024458525|nr:uncharacterized protein LOC129588628 [Paramacrobiotus metropolitanus]